MNRPGTFSQQLLSSLEKEPDYPHPSPKPNKLWTIRKLKNASLLHCVDSDGYSDVTPPHHIFKIPNKKCKEIVAMEYPFPPIDEIVITPHRANLQIISIFTLRKDYSLDTISFIHALEKLHPLPLPFSHIYLPRFVICPDQFRQVFYLTKVYFPKVKILTFEGNLFRIEDDLSWHLP